MSWVGSHGCIASVLQIMNVDLPITEPAQPVLPGDQMSLERTVLDRQHPGAVQTERGTQIRQNIFKCQHL